MTRNVFVSVYNNCVARCSIYSFVILFGYLSNLNNPVARLVENELSNLTVKNVQMFTFVSKKKINMC